MTYVSTFAEAEIGFKYLKETWAEMRLFAHNVMNVWACNITYLHYLHHVADDIKISVQINMNKQVCLSCVCNLPWSWKNYLEIYKKHMCIYGTLHSSWKFKKNFYIVVWLVWVVQGLCL